MSWRVEWRFNVGNIWSLCDRGDFTDLDDAKRFYNECIDRKPLGGHRHDYRLTSSDGLLYAPLGEGVHKLQVAVKLPTRPFRPSAWDHIIKDDE
jgi:hypothetical protein